MRTQGNQNYSRRAIIDTVTPEFVETLTHATSASFSSEASRNNVVPRGTHTQERRATSKLSSPSQRLRRAVIMRRQRIAEAAEHDVGASSSVVPAPESILGPDTSSRVLSEAGERDSKTQRPEDDEGINDRDVLRGLRIICAASADAELDTLVWSKSGVLLRRFLADLQSFEELGEATAGDKTAISEAGGGK
jgi:hypothetical protein